MYNGHVFHKDGHPLAGMRVSDGCNITVTDEHGSFSLPGWERAHVIAVQCLTLSHDDWFAMIDGHTGDFDFYITPADAPADHSFFHISDSEITEADECDGWLPFIRKQIPVHSPAFLIHTGDICRIKGLENHRLAMNYETMGIPIRYTLGNHDYVDDRYGEYSFERMYGPVWYSFDLGNTHYVVLPIKGGEAPGCYLPEDSDRWLASDLRLKDPDKSLVLFSHSHCQDEDGFTYCVDGTPFCLRDYGLLAWVFGHYHIHFCTDLGGYYNICTSRPDCGGIDTSPAGVRCVTVSGDGTLTTALLYNDLSDADTASPALWDTALDGRVLYADPLIDGDRVYVCTEDDGLPCRAGIFCLDAATGTVIWRYPTFAGVKNIPALTDGMIVAQDTFGWVYALNAETGALVWKSRVSLYWGHHAENGVCVGDGKIFCGCGRVVSALSQEDGSLLWQTGKSESSEDSPARFVFVTAEQEGRTRHILLVNRQWRYLYALDTDTGETLWQNRDVRYAIATPCIADGCIIAHTAGRMLRIDLLTGLTLQDVTADPACSFNTVGQPLLHDGLLFVPTADRGMAAVDPHTLQPQRFYTVGETLCPMSPYKTHGILECEGAPVFADGLILFASPDGCLHICDIVTAETLQVHSLGAPCYTAPVLYKNTVICADFAGHVRAFPVC